MPHNEARQKKIDLLWGITCLPKEASRSQARMNALHHGAQ
jgi:hypothetical protein